MTKILHMLGLHSWHEVRLYRAGSSTVRVLKCTLCRKLKKEKY